ncbi:McrB family protein [Tamlana flava]|uniref:McrB family protein n=1 Tax=Tamlana flava TaxID=3158572 RepID=UPI00351B53C9
MVKSDSPIKASSIVDWSNIILDFLIQKRTQIPDLKFGLRQQNRNNRLDKGYWFQGTDRYLSVGFSKIGAGNLSTKSIGFVVEINSKNQENCKIHIIFKKVNDEKLLACYDKIIKTLGGFEKLDDKDYVKKYETNAVLENLEQFLAVEKPKIDKIIDDMGLRNEMIFSDEKFDKMLNNILEIKKNQKSIAPFSIILANITWNSKNWKEISEDTSGHTWVSGGNIPHESWNFDFDNPRNKDNKVYGFVKFTNSPAVRGGNNLIIFYSQGKIVGFYGKTEVLKDWVDINERESYNLIADKGLSVVLPNKIEDLKEKGYLENLNRVGQVGFSYLKKNETAINILNEAIQLNPELSEKLNDIKEWILNQNSDNETSTDFDFSSFEEYLKKFNHEDLRTYFSFLFEVLDEFKLEEGDDRLLFSTTNNNLSFTIGQRYSWSLFKSNKKGKFGVLSIDKIRPNSEAFKGNAPHPYYTHFNEVNFSESDKDSIFKGFDQELKRTNKTGFRKHSNNEFEKAVYDKNFRSQFVNSTSMKQENKVLNKILFGPPGTGKTFNTVNESLKIVDPDFYTENKNNRDALNKRFKELLIKNWDNTNGQIAFCTFHQSFSYEDFVEGIKPKINEKKEVFYKIEDGVFKRICQLADTSTSDVKMKKDFFVNNGQLIESESKKVKDYVLIIDEINRGNVSSIFGELITLIEKDKRAGGKEELEVILPYSKVPFKVPQNVHIIGTMNTADRSIEALDTALRRRFSFNEKPPKPELILTEGRSGKVYGIVDGVNLKDLLETINIRIEKLIDKDHKIGHSYFLKVNDLPSLKKCFQNEVIPLLEEYFFGDYGKIGLVLGDSFVTKDVSDDFEFAKFEGYDTDVSSDLKERPVYKITTSERWDFKSI